MDFDKTLSLLCLLFLWNKYYLKRIIYFCTRFTNSFTLPGGDSWGLLTDAAEILMGAEFTDLFYVPPAKIVPPGVFEIPTTGVMGFIFNLCPILGLSMFDRDLFFTYCNAACDFLKRGWHFTAKNAYGCCSQKEKETRSSCSSSDFC